MLISQCENAIILFVCPSKILHKHCFYFLLVLIMVPRETGNNAYKCKIFEGQTKSIIVILVLANLSYVETVLAAMLVFQNKGMAAMMVYQTNPPGIKLYFYANTFFCFSNSIWLLVT